MAFGDDATMVANAVGKHIEFSIFATGMTSLTVYRVNPGGNITVRGAEDVAPTGADLWAGAEYEAPQGADLTYGADLTDGATVFTITANVNGQVDYGGDFIMPVGNPNLGTNITIEAGGIAPLVRDVVQDIQPVLNRRSPVVVSFGRRYFQSEFRILTLSDVQRANLESLLSYPVLFFVARANYGFDEPLYLAVGRAEEERTSPLGAEDSRRWYLQVTRVDRPPADYAGTQIGDSWQTVKDVPNTWTTVSANYTDWYDVAGYPA